MLRLAKWAGMLFALVLALAGGPIVGTEVLCHATPRGAPYKPILSDPAQRRPAANSYMSYPEWHIVYAYEGLAKTLDDGDEYQFRYLESITGFWRAECRLLRAADEHGGADFDTRATSYVIGPSFGLELALKALYEDTIGRLFAAFRGARKSPQDLAARAMAHDYARFLQQTPWYEYDFQKAIDDLWAAPVVDLRGWERRAALTIEWKAKILYAKGIKSLVAATTGDAELEIISVVTNVSRESLGAIPGVRIVAEAPQGLIIKTPRYAAFNDILIEIAKIGGNMVEIAGNDNLLMTTLRPESGAADYGTAARLLTSLRRQGFGEERDLLEVDVSGLT